MAVFRAVQPRAISGGRPFLGRLRQDSAPAGGDRGTPCRRLQDPRRAGASPRHPRLPGRRAIHDRRHRAVRVHPCRRRRRIRPLALSGHPSLARARRRRRRPCADRSAAGLSLTVGHGGWGRSAEPRCCNGPWPAVADAGHDARIRLEDTKKASSTVTGRSLTNGRVRSRSARR